jgi:3'(2'), 5'-bisphosphate nucleotidase
LPTPALSRRASDQVFDPIRQLWVQLTPEEWVRLHAVEYLISVAGCPKGLIAIEKGHLADAGTRRTDITVYGRDGNPWMILECKAPDIVVGQKTLDQVSRYANVLVPQFVGVTNGMQLFVAKSESEGVFSFVPEFPLFPKAAAATPYPMPDLYRAELASALRAVTAASELTERVRASTARETLHKGDRSPVTVADFGSQALVCRELEASFPGDAIIAEENADELRTADHVVTRNRVAEFVRESVPDATAEDIVTWIDRGTATDYSERFWTLDPIDGTKGFLRGDQYAVALALIVDGHPVVAALACPSLPSLPKSRAGLVLFAVKGGGCFRLLSGQTPEKAIRVFVSEVDDPSSARMAESVESGHSSHGDSARVSSALGISAKPRRMDSQAKYAVVAQGEVDLYMRLPVRKSYSEKIWDHAAGALVVEEAGGRVTDVHGKPLEFKHGSTLVANTGVVASNGRIHDALLAVLAAADIKAV